MMLEDNTIRAVEQTEKGILLVVFVLGMLLLAKGDFFFLICECRFKHYVELLEPAGPRACIRCCDDADDCPTTQGNVVLF
jgi:hypothetical protein